MISRRDTLKAAAAVLGCAALEGPALSGTGLRQAKPAGAQYNQAVARWCYQDIPLDDFARAIAEMGIKGMDLVGPEDWPALKKHGLVCSITSGGGTIADGLNRKGNHDKIARELSENIPRAAAAGVPNVITFSGNRRGLSDQEGLENCVIGLNRVKGLAEKHGVTICLELLNSKVDHKDYQCDHTAWGAAVVRQVGSPRVKLLYDIYHMQIMEGDLIRTIKANIQHIGHFHTAGNPGRQDLDETQEIYYPAVMRAIAETGYQGYVGHELTPKGDPMEALRKTFKLCDV